MRKNKKIYLILHNIRSAQNVGAIFRTSDAAGISKIYLTGYTPAPVDHFGIARKDIVKTALGAEKSVKWEYARTATSIINKLRKQRAEIIAVEQNGKAIDYKKIKINSDAAFIFGNEVKGLSKTILDKSDKIAQIKMFGKKESLNVSVTAGIFLFRVLNI